MDQTSWYIAAFWSVLCPAGQRPSVLRRCLSHTRAIVSLLAQMKFYQHHEVIIIRKDAWYAIAFGIDQDSLKARHSEVALYRRKPHDDSHLLGHLLSATKWFNESICVTAPV